MQVQVQVHIINTYIPTYLPTYIPACLPAYLPAPTQNHKPAITSELRTNPKQQNARHIDASRATPAINPRHVGTYALQSYKSTTRPTRFFFSDANHPTDAPVPAPILLLRTPTWPPWSDTPMTTAQNHVLNESLPEHLEVTATRSQTGSGTSISSRPTPPPQRIHLLFSIKQARKLARVCMYVCIYRLGLTDLPLLSICPPHAYQSRPSSVQSLRP